MGVELSGKTLGIVGCGNIGTIVADRAHGLKMKVLAFDPYLSEDRACDLNVEKVELDDLLARADFITLHTPLTDSTRHIINAAALAKTRPGVRIINCARGELVVEEDLKAAHPIRPCGRARRSTSSPWSPPAPTPSSAWSRWWPRPISAPPPPRRRRRWRFRSPSRWPISC